MRHERWRTIRDDQGDEASVGRYGLVAEDDKRFSEVLGDVYVVGYRNQIQTAAATEAICVDAGGNMECNFDIVADGVFDVDIFRYGGSTTPTDSAYLVQHNKNAQHNDASGAITGTTFFTCEIPTMGTKSTQAATVYQGITGDYRCRCGNSSELGLIADTTTHYIIRLTNRNGGAATYALNIEANVGW